MSTSSLDPKNIHLLIATPAYGANVCSEYTESLIHTCDMLRMMNIKYEVKFINNQIVTRARNMLCYYFLNNDFTNMIFIDADVVWKPEYIIALLSHKKECVIGVYPNKRYFHKPDGGLFLKPSSQYNKDNSDNIIFDSSNDDLIEIARAATGFMMLEKSALERIKKYVDYFFLPSGDKVCTVYNFFDCNVVDHDYLTEDFYFSYLYNKHGGTIYADKRIELLHIGNHKYGSLLTK
jgi:hypothetical protein